jgi:hypothetical protein
VARKGVCLLLARAAARTAACTADIAQWLTTDQSAADGPIYDHDHQPDRTKETTVKETSTLEQPFAKTLQADATEAAWRAAGSQFVKLTREPLVALLSRHLAPGDESLRARIAAFLETEIGTAMLSALLSAGLSALPDSAGAAPARMARELRVRAMADAGDLIAEVLIGPLRQVAAMYLQDGTPATAPDPLAVLAAGAPSAANRTVLHPERKTATAA